MNLFKRRKAKKSKEIGKTKVDYDEALRTGSSIGRIATYIWNSQKTRVELTYPLVENPYPNKSNFNSTFIEL